MRILRYTLFLFAIGLISCEQEFDKKEGVRKGYPLFLCKSPNFPKLGLFNLL